MNVLGLGFLPDQDDALTRATLLFCAVCIEYRPAAGCSW